MSSFRLNKGQGIKVQRREQRMVLGQGISWETSRHRTCYYTKSQESPCCLQPRFPAPLCQCADVFWCPHATQFFSPFQLKSPLLWLIKQWRPGKVRMGYIPTYNLVLCFSEQMSLGSLVWSTPRLSKVSEHFKIYHSHYVILCFSNIQSV